MAFRNAFQGGRQTLFLIHGWTGGPGSNWMHSMKNALLDKVSYLSILACYMPIIAIIKKQYGICEGKYMY